MKKKNIIIYTVISYAWSYTFWLIAIVLAYRSNIELELNEGFVEALYSSELIGKVAILSIIALVATWGPMIGTLVITKIDPDFKEKFSSSAFVYRGFKQYLIVIAIFLAIGFAPAIPLIFIEGFESNSVSIIILYLFTFFVIQLVTSGTEEIGWRGFLLPEFLKKYDTWAASFRTGIIWALWHAPVVLYIFYLQDMPLFAMVFSFFGFSVGIIAMSAVHSYFFIKTRSVLFSVYLHAMSNTIPLITGLLILNAYKTAILSQLLIWVVVAVIIKKNPRMFPKKEKNS